MLVIAHKGNLTGPDHSTENAPGTILAAIRAVGNAEVDLLHALEGIPVLGHDNSRKTYPVDKEFLNTSGLWIHCKTISAFRYCHDHSIKNPYFIHDKDDLAIVLSKGKAIYTWSTHLLYDIFPPTIVVDTKLDIDWWGASNVGGVCTDFPLKYLELIKARDMPAVEETTDEPSESSSI